MAPQAAADALVDRNELALGTERLNRRQRSLKSLTPSSLSSHDSLSVTALFSYQQQSASKKHVDLSIAALKGALSAWKTV